MYRAISYVDGFNLYYGLKKAGLQCYYWLNIKELSKRLIRPNQELVFTKYFTTRITALRPNRSQAEKGKRQGTFLEALDALSDFRTFFGQFLINKVECFRCGDTWPDPEEKMTDVNIATEMLTDAFQDNYDTALLISADSDLVPTVLAIQNLFPEKKIVVAFPPKYHSAELKKYANAAFSIWHDHFKKSLFPDEVRKDDGFVLQRPDSWR
jgi:hypothetical protein